MSGILNFLLSFIGKLRKLILWIGFLYLFFLIFYNFLYLPIIVLTYHIFLSGAWISSFLGWTSIQIYFLFFIALLPDLLKTLGKILRKFI